MTVNMQKQQQLVMNTWTNLLASVREINRDAPGVVSLINVQHATHSDNQEQETAGLRSVQVLLITRIISSTSGPGFETDPGIVVR